MLLDAGLICSDVDRAIELPDRILAWESPAAGEHLSRSVRPRHQTRRHSSSTGDDPSALALFDTPGDALAINVADQLTAR